MTQRTNEILVTLIIPNLAEDVGYKVAQKLSIASIGIDPPTTPEKLSTQQPWPNILRQDIPSMHDREINIFSNDKFVFFRTFSPFISRDRDLEAIIKMSKASRMTVVKRDGREEVVHFDKITSRIEKLCYGLDMDYIDPAQITVKVINGLYAGVTTVELDNLAAEIAATMTTKHPDYAILAAR